MPPIIKGIKLGFKPQIIKFAVRNPQGGLCARNREWRGPQEGLETPVDWRLIHEKRNNHNPNISLYNIISLWQRKSIPLVVVKPRVMQR